MTDEPTDELCHLCPHPAGPHVLITTGATPMDGGIRLCPHPECQCFSTWSRFDRSKDSVVVPGDEDIALYRDWVQMQDHSVVEPPSPS